MALGKKIYVNYELMLVDDLERNQFGLINVHVGCTNLKKNACICCICNKKKY